MLSVSDTNLEAMKAKRSASLLGYFQDKFVEVFVKERVKKDVVLNRGYWLRYMFFSRLVRRFIESNKNAQVISLGCGYDTLPFNMLNEYEDVDFKYIELDLQKVVQRKIQFIKKDSILVEMLQKDNLT